MRERESHSECVRMRPKRAMWGYLRKDAEQQSAPTSPIKSQTSATLISCWSPIGRFARKIIQFLAPKQGVPLFLFYTCISALMGTTLYGQATHIYWVDGSLNGAIHRSSIASPSVETILSTGEVAAPVGITIDNINDTVFWANSTSSGGAPHGIRKANVDGSSPSTLATGIQNTGVAVDPTGGKVYWSSDPTDSIRSKSISGGSTTTFVNLPSDADPRGIAVDTSANKLYWVEQAGNIKRINLDGTSQETLFSSGVGPYPEDLTLDVAGGKMYWVGDGFGAGYINVANMDGTGSISVFKTGLSYATGVEVDPVAQKIYWTDRSGSGAIRRSDLDGSNTETILSGLSFPGYLTLFTQHTFYWDDTSGNERSLGHQQQLGGRCRPHNRG